MPHHHTKNTVQASAYCNTCNEVTMHLVSDGRIGLCVNQHAKTPEPKPVEPENKQGGLFDEGAPVSGGRKTS